MTGIMVLVRSRRKTWSEHFLRNLPNMSFHDSAASTSSTLAGEQTWNSDTVTIPRILIF